MNLTIFRVSFELEPGAVGQNTDFKESSKRLEWSLKKAMSFSDAIMFSMIQFAIYLDC